eukprot:4571660-Prymnesium_polylepis.1
MAAQRTELQIVEGRHALESVIGTEHEVFELVQCDHVMRGEDGFDRAVHLHQHSLKCREWLTDRLHLRPTLFMKQALERAEIEKLRANACRCKAARLEVLNWSLLHLCLLL